MQNWSENIFICSHTHASQYIPGNIPMFVTLHVNKPYSRSAVVEKFATKNY